MDDAAAPQSGSFSYKRLIPVAVLVVGLVLFFALDLGRFLSFEALRQNRATLLDWVDTYGIVAALIYMLIYAAAIAFSLPGGAVLTITGGFLFGSLWGTLCVVIAATAGATALFLIAKTSFGDALRAKAGPALQKMQEGFQEGALSYLLVLRLVPIFPFFLVNLVPAFLGVTLRVYVLGTFIGIIPGTFVFATVGAGLGSVFDQGGSFSAAGILTPQIITALVGLAVLALIPVVYKKIKGRSQKTAA
ncbi:MAG: TVP38/TMEM64 family protein [Candidatus Tectomicrobia bacterium]|nr:TVP38/TMEM64 family protein [Candidatus Tectomicrobia bacterium]